MDMLEKAARAAHECLSDANIMAYLDMPHDTAEKTARAVIQAIREPLLEICSEHDGRDDRGDFGCGMQWASECIAGDLKKLIDAILSEGE